MTKVPTNLRPPRGGSFKTRMIGARRQTFSSLEVPNYRRYFIGQSVSLLGNYMQMTAQTWLVLTLTHSGTSLGWIVAIQTLPILVLSPYGGIIADRFDKRKLMLILQSLMGLTALILGLLSLFHVVRLWEVFVLAGCLGLSNAFANPARQSFIREIVDADVLRNAFTLYTVMGSAARAFGPAIAGVIIAVAGESPCFLINAGSFVAVIASLILMDRSLLRPSKPTVRERGQLMEGFRYAIRTPTIALPLVMMLFIGTFAFEFQVSIPILTSKVFHDNSEAYGYLLAMMGVGGGIGGLISAARNRAGVRALALSAFGFGLSMFLLAATTSVVVAYVAMILIGWSSVAFTTLAISTVQLNSASNMRGRTSALYQVAFQGTSPIGGPCIGWITSIAGARVGIAVGGGFCFVAVASAYLIARRIEEPGQRSAEKMIA